MSSDLQDIYDTEDWKKDKVFKLLRLSGKVANKRLYELFRLRDLSGLSCGSGRFACVWPYRSDTSVLKLTLCKKDALNAAHIYASGKEFTHLVKVYDPGVVKLVDKDGKAYYLWRTKRLKPLSTKKSVALMSMVFKLSDGEYGRKDKIYPYNKWALKHATSLIKELTEIKGFPLLYDAMWGMNVMQNYKGVPILHDFETSVAIGLHKGRILLASEV